MSQLPLPILDRAEGLRRVAGDERLYGDLVDVFLRDLPRVLGLMDAALATQMPTKLQCAAHSLRGSALQIGARAVAECAAQLETIARRGNLTDAPALRRRLDDALAQLQTACGQIGRSA